MGDLGYTHNPGDYEQAADFSQPIPEGEYSLLIDRAEVKTTKAGDGSYLNIMYKVLDGPHKSRSFFDMITLSNPNQKAVDIGRKQMEGLIASAGLGAVEDSSQLLGKTVTATVKVETDDYGTKNRVGVFKAKGTQSAPAPVASDDEPAF